MGGTLEIASRPGQGSRITVAVPAGVPTAEIPSLPAAARACGRPEIGSQGKTRILLVDDHAVVRAGLAQLLASEADLEVVGQGADGREAIALADRLQPDVVLMDVRMPGIDGIAATRAIHAAHPGIRIIGLSMYDEVEHVRAMREAGAEVILSKGGAPGHLIATIRGTPARTPPGPIGSVPT